MRLATAGGKGMSEEVALKTGQSSINTKEGGFSSSQSSSSITSDGAVPLRGTLTTVWGRSDYLTYFTNEETEAQRKQQKQSSRGWPNEGHCWSRAQRMLGREGKEALG